MNRLYHIIASQGYLEVIGEYKMQPWIENINSILLNQGHYVHVLTCGSKSKEIKNKNLKITVSKSLPFINDPFSPDLIARICISGKPQLAVIHGLQHILTLVSFIIYSLHKVPVIIIVHGIYHINSKSGYIRDQLIKWALNLFKNSFLLLSLTDFDKKILVKNWGIRENNIIVTAVPLFINNKELEKIKFEKEKKINKTHTIFTILFIGRLSKEKRVELLINSISKIRQLGKAVRVIIVGDGPEKNYLYNLVKQLGLTREVLFMGAVSHEKIWKFLIQCDILVLPSTSEGFPRVFLEAFLCEKVVLASKVSGNTEIIKNGFNGLLFNDEKELVEQIMMLLRDKKKLKSMTKNIRGIRKKYILNFEKNFFLDLQENYIKYIKN